MEGFDIGFLRNLIIRILEENDLKGCRVDCERSMRSDSYILTCEIPREVILMSLGMIRRLALAERIKDHEGFRSKPYRCSAGKLTIGYGRNIEDVGITKSEAERLLLNDLEVASLSVAPIANRLKLNEARKGVLVEMVYNLGLNGMLGFKKMLAAIEAEDYEQAAVEMLDSKWAKQVGQRAITLAKIMRTGIE